MDFDSIWTAYYSLFRADSDIPASTEDEYTVGMRMANEALNRWANYDGVYWKELYDTNQTDGTGVQTVTTGTTTYAAPTNFKEAGGYVRLLNSDGVVQHRYPILDPNETQFTTTLNNYCYFTGNPKDGYTLHLSPSPPSNYDGWDIEYDYYKKPTEYSTGATVSEIPDPYFVVHRMLANQFRAARNPYYSSAKADAENALRQMKIDNDSGTWASPWSQADNSGTRWGV
jgi:hypothetical protein